MKKTIIITAIISIFMIPSILNAEQAKGLNILINSENTQTQAMAMVLSLKTLIKHKREVNIVLCESAGDLADKNIDSIAIKRPNGKAPSAKKHLKILIEKGARIEICPLYLPNAGKDKSVLLKGITVAKPLQVAGRLLDKDYQNITF